MTRTMVDSTSASSCPPGADIYAGYKDGAWRSYPDMLARFPGAVHCGVVVNPGNNDGDVLDVEQGDATPQQAPAWVQMRRGSGVARPCCYCNRGNLGAVDQALAAARIPVWAAVLWVATLDGTVVRGSSAHGYAIVACQDRSAAMNGANFDSSDVFDDTWLPSPPAPTSYPPTPLQGGGMRQAILITTDGAGDGWDNQFRQRNIPWTGFKGAPFLNGTDPDVNIDNRYPTNGTVRAQQRDGLLLVEVMGCQPNSTELVWVDAV